MSCRRGLRGRGSTSSLWEFFYHLKCPKCNMVHMFDTLWSNFILFNYRVLTNLIFKMLFWFAWPYGLGVLGGGRPPIIRNLNKSGRKFGLSRAKNWAVIFYTARGVRSEVWSPPSLRETIPYGHAGLSQPTCFHVWENDMGIWNIINTVPFFTGLSFHPACAADMELSKLFAIWGTVRVQRESYSRIYYRGYHRGLSDLIFW